MKIGKNLSLVSILLMITLLVVKISYDIKIYNEFMLQKNANQGFASASYIIPKYYFFIITISIVISIIGYIKKNKFRKIGLSLNLISVIYLLFPILWIAVEWNF